MEVALKLVNVCVPKVHKCTESNFDDLVKTSVDAGKTLFVRWIASEG